MDDNQEQSTTERGAATAGRNLPDKTKYLVSGLIIGGAIILLLRLILTDSANQDKKSPITQEELPFSTGAVVRKPIPPVNLDEKVKSQETQHINNTNALQAEKERMIALRAMELAQKEHLARKQSMEQRNKAPLFAFNTMTNSNYQSGTTNSQGNLSSTSSFSDNPNQQFFDKATQQQVKTAVASQLSNTSTVITQGTLISAVLESAIQSDLPGMVRAIVNRDVHSFDHAQILIPKGSRLIGQYQSGIQRGQTRVFVIWNRVLRPDGVSVQLASLGTDPLGRSGMAGFRDTHFFERFGASILLSLIDGGISAGINAVDDKEAATVAINSGRDINRASEIALTDSINISPTIHINQGEPINIFVAQDLDFSTISQ